MWGDHCHSTHTHTHLADGLELLVLVIVACQQEAAVGARPLSFAQVGADHTQVHRVAHALQVVFLQLWRREQLGVRYSACIWWLEVLHFNTAEKYIRVWTQSHQLQLLEGAGFLCMSLKPRGTIKHHLLIMWTVRGLRCCSGNDDRLIVFKMFLSSRNLKPVWL